MHELHIDIQIDHELVNWKFKFTEEAKSIPSKLAETQRGKTKYLEQEKYVDNMSYYLRHYMVDEDKVQQIQNKLETTKILINEKIHEQDKTQKENEKKARLSSIIDCISDLQFISKDSEDNKNENKELSEKSFENAINRTYKIIEEPYLKAWKQDFVCTLVKLKGFDNQITEMSDEYKQIAAELIDAIQNDTLDDFIGFNYEGERNKESEEKLKKDNKRLQDLIELFELVNKKIKLSVQESRVNVDEFESSLNKLYKKKFKYIRLLKDDEGKLEKYRELKELANIISENAKENYDVLTKAFNDIHKEEDNQKKKNLNTIDYKGATIIIRKNDLTQEVTEAIVNPANEQLEHAGGCAYMIASKAGDKFHEDCREYIRKNTNLSTGSAMLTSAGGSLCCDKVIHTVGPKYNKNLPDNSLAHCQLKMCTNKIMEIMKSENIKSVSIPAVSTGIFGFPISRCAAIMGSTIKSYIDSNSEMRNREIVFCNFDDETTNIFLKIIPNCFIEKQVEPDNDDCDENKSDEDDNDDDDEDSRDNAKKKKRSKKRKDSEEEEEDDEDEDESVEVKSKNKKAKNKRNKRDRDEEDDDEDEEDQTEEVKKKKNKKRSKCNQFI